VADEVSHLQCRSLAGGDHLSDGTTLKGLTDLERRNVALAVNHSAAHVGVDGHPDVPDQHLSVSRRGDGGLHVVEVLWGRHAHGAAFQADFVTCQVRHG
jgi:hypothetical protein